MSTYYQNEHAEKVNMEISKLKFVRDNGTIRLPPGFRFQPTDQEIVFQYLIRKVFSCPLPASIVPETVNICKFSPWDLPGDMEQDRYFFSKREAKYGNGNRLSDGGYWKATSLDKQITRRCCNSNSNSRKRVEIITGMKKTFVFYKGKQPAAHGDQSTTRTYWTMHEYRLVHSPNHSKQTNDSNNKKSWIQMGDWVLCHIFLNKRSTRNNVRVIDGMDVKYEPSSSSSSSTSSSSSCGSSVVTNEVTSSRKLLYPEEQYQE